MFVFRAAFWLVIGFVLVAPHGTDFGAALGGVKDQALAAGVQAGEQLVASEMLTPGAAQGLLSSLSSSPPSVAVPMQASSTVAFVFPRPRPAAMG